MSADRRHLRLTCCGNYALTQLEQVDREIAALPRYCGCCGDEDKAGLLLRRESVQEVVHRAMQALVMEGSPPLAEPAAPLGTPGATVRVRIEVMRHGDHGRWGWGWLWRVLVMEGAGAQYRPVAVVAQGVAPTQALAERRAHGAWEVFSADYSGHYDLEIPGG